MNSLETKRSSTSKKSPSEAPVKRIRQTMATVDKPPIKVERITTGLEKDGVEHVILESPLGEGIAPASSVMGIPPYQAKSGEEYMNDPQRQHFRDILERWKQQLMEAVDQTVSHMKDEAANFPDPNDRATQEEEFTLELRTRDRERKLIKKIDEAFERLKGDDYGFCEACGIEIGIRRLEARPTATLCIDCKTVYEIRERQTG